MVEFLNIILLFICLVGFIISVFFIFKGKDRNEKIISSIFTIVSLVFAVQGSVNIYTSYYNTIFEYNNYIDSLEHEIVQIKQENSKIISIVNSNNNLIKKIVKIEDYNFSTNSQITYNTMFEDNNTDAETLMNYAKYYYNAKNYEGVVRIYGNSKLSDNVIALTNLGYMYANGIYFEQDLEQAEFYYNKAIALGYDRALSNKLAMYLKYNLDNIIELFQLGYSLNNDAITDFIYSFYNDSDNIGSQKCFEDFVNKKENIQNEIIENMYYYDYKSSEIFYSPPTNNELHKYHYIRRVDSENYIAAYYEIYDLKCYNIELLREDFIY